MKCGSLRGYISDFMVGRERKEGWIYIRESATKSTNSTCYTSYEGSECCLPTGTRGW
jgi:hypothetical protein